MKLVNLRHDIPGQFDNDEAFNVVARQYIEAREKARALGRRYTVAPKQSLRTRDGRVLQPGDEVRSSDFEHVRRHAEGDSLYERSPAGQLEDLVYRGIVIEADVRTREPEPPAAA